MAGQGPSFIADGNITPMAFVTDVGVSADNRVLQASFGSKIIGISQPQQRQPPWGALQDGYAAKQGELLRVFTQGEVCWLILGSNVSIGNRLFSDANGHGAPVGSAGQEYGAIALEAGSAGQQIRVQVVLGQTYTGS